MTTTPPPEHVGPDGQEPPSPAAYARATPVQSQYPPQGWQPVVPRAPLTARQKGGALWAGIVGFNMMSLGWVLFIVPIAVGLFAAFFTFVLDQIGSSGAPSSSSGYYQLRDFVDTFNIRAWIVPVLLLSLVGLLIWAGGILVSGGILKSRAVNHPWGVTWAAAGIAIVGYWVVSGVVGFVIRIITVAVSSAAEAPWWATLAITGGMSLVVAIVLNCVIGWLAWWWMAHAMRARQAAE